MTAQGLILDGHLNCPRCGLSIKLRAGRAAIRHCPRCLGRSRTLVELFNSTLPSHLLYGEGSSPTVEEEPSPSRELSTVGAGVTAPESTGRKVAVNEFRRARGAASES